MTRKVFNINSLRKAMYMLMVATMTFAASTIMQSCDNDNDDFPLFPLNRPNALVTVKPTANGSAFFMQLDDSTRITASNIKAAPYGNREVRAFINFRLLTQPVDKHKYEVYVNWIDSILTKPMAEYPGREATSSQFRQDPVELLRDWTVSEDGYMTIHLSLIHI